MIVQISVLFSIGIFIGISQSAGIGGGIIINVLLIIGLGYNTKDSVFISYIFLLGGGLASTLASFKKKLSSGKSIIDNDLIMTTLPMIMSGAIFGTIVNHFISQLVISILFVVIMLYMGYMTCKKTKNTPPPLIESQAESMLTSKQNSVFKEVLDKQNRSLLCFRLLIIAQIYFYTVIILLIKDNYLSFWVINVEKCSAWSWELSFLHVVLSLLYSKAIASKKINIDQEKSELGYVFTSQNDKMSYRKMKQGMFNGFAAGFAGACVGIGGGMVLLPLWFRAGIDKNVAASSTGPLIFFSASVSFFISVMSNKYESTGLIFIFLGTGLIGSYVIKRLVLYLVDRYSLKLFLRNLMLAIIIISMISFVPIQVIKYNQNPDDFMFFGTLC